MFNHVEKVTYSKVGTKYLYAYFQCFRNLKKKVKQFYDTVYYFVNIFSDLCLIKCLLSNSNINEFELEFNY